MFLPRRCCYTRYIWFHMLSSVYHTVLFHPFYIPSSLSHCRGLHGSDLWSNLLIAIPAFFTTLILKPCRFISFWYFLCSCEFGVADTKTTASFPRRWYQSFFFLTFSCSRSSRRMWIKDAMSKTLCCYSSRCVELQFQFHCVKMEYRPNKHPTCCMRANCSWRDNTTL